MDVLTVQDLHKSFGDKQVLRGLELSVPEHSVFGFVGRNGGGKTTAMKIALGLLTSDRGEVYVSGERVVYGQTSTNRFVGYLPDVPSFYSFMTAREYLKLCGKSLDMSKRDIEERSTQLLSLVGLSEERHRIKGFSRGMKQRLGIAQALLARPKLLICDEPTSALDPVGRKEILEILSSVREQTTVLFSTHILSDVERICTDVAFLHNGKIALGGRVEALMRTKGKTRFTVELDDPQSSAQVKAAFADATKIEGSSVSFSGGEEQMYRVLDFIRANRLPLHRIEREKPSLEALFLEVVNE